MSRATLLLLLTCCSGFAQPAIVFEEGFESGVLSPSWEIETTADGRVRVLSDFGPATGQRHMVLDDSVSDALYSSARAILHLDLSNKRNVVLSFKAKSLGNEPDYPPYGTPNPQNFDGVSFSTDGVNWRTIEWLAEIGPDWETFTIFFNDWYDLPTRFGPDFQIRFSEFDNASAPLDGIAIDDVRVTADPDLRTLVEVPQKVAEGSGPHYGVVLLTYAQTNAVTLSLVASPAGQLLLPESVVIPAGQTAATFEFSAVGDDLVNLTRSVFITAQAAGYSPTPGVVTLVDDDTPTATLLLPPQLAEGDYSVRDNASISLSRAPSVPMTIYLSHSFWNELDLPYAVTVPAGSTSVTFTVRASDDNRIDGDVLVLVIAESQGMVPATAQTVTLDNEKRLISLELPVTVGEGGTATGFIKLSGTSATNLVVQLTSSNPSSVSVPASVTIPANYWQMEFTITAPDNSLRDGSRTANLSASAETFLPTNGTISVRDNEVVGYRFSGVADIVEIGRPLTITVSAADIEGNAIEGSLGVVELSLVYPDDSAQTLTSVPLSGTNGWTGDITLPPFSEGPLRLRATNGAGLTGTSNPFDFLRALPLPATDLVWDPARARLYASVSADAPGTNANKVLAIHPVTGEILAGVLVGQSPGRLALTSGGEFLYAALDDNGTVARINPATMTVASTFSIGTHPNWGTLMADDLCTVPGQPNLLVVSQSALTDPSRHTGVAVYDNGVARPTKTPEYYGHNFIEPSADPAFFFSVDSSYENVVRRLQIGTAGIAEVEVRRNLLDSSPGEARSDGDWLFGARGAVVDGLQLRRLGAFPTGGLVCPDRVKHRVFFLEQKYPDYWYSEFDRIGIYNPATFSQIRSLTLPRSFQMAQSFIRWGTNGLAFVSETNVVLIRSSRIVPTDPSADLSVTVEVEPSPAVVSAPLTYTVTVFNHGPNAAASTFLTFALSDSQRIQSAVASVGSPNVSSNTATLEVGGLASGTGFTLTVTTLPDSAGFVVGTAGVTSAALDPNFANNAAAEIVAVGFQPAIDTVQRLRLPANNLIYDPTRLRIWASIPGTTAPPLARTVVSIDPINGLLSAPIPIDGEPAPQCMALSANGRYLYVGLSSTNQILRLDLLQPGTSLRIPLEQPQYWNANAPRDIEVLDGDGTSFLVVGSADSTATVYDGQIPRGLRTAQYSVSRIERTGLPGRFIGYYPNSSVQFSTLTVTAAGVTNTRQAANVISSAGPEIHGSGHLVLVSSGQLVNSTNLSLAADFGMSGRPCLDLPNHRAYLVRGNILSGFDTMTLLPAADFELPFTVSDYWYENSQVETCLRWGIDGFAFLAGNSNVHIWRWSKAIPAAADSNNDGISDAWEATHFGTLKVSLTADPDGDGLCNFQEYLFATSPTQWSANPIRVFPITVDGQPAVRLVFTRRAGLAPPAYDYQISLDLKEWSPAPNVSESVLATQNILGIDVDTVEATIPMLLSPAGFVRFRWILP